MLALGLNPESRTMNSNSLRKQTLVLDFDPVENTNIFISLCKDSNALYIDLELSNMGDNLLCN